jgi:hypothetical protein
LVPGSALPRFIGAGLLLAASVAANASLAGFTDEASFQAATTGLPAEWTNFDTLGAGDPVAGGAGFSLSVSAAGSLAVVATGFWTTSGVNYLGLNNVDGQFLNGDLLTFTFARPATAFGVYVVGGSDLANPAFTDVGVQLTTGAFSVSTSKLPDRADGQGSFAFFIGVVGTGSTLNSVTLSGFSPGLLEYAVDDVRVVSSVPESASGQLLALGLLGLAAWRRHRPPKAQMSTLKNATLGEFA